MQNKTERVQCRLPLAADEANGIKVFMTVMRTMTIDNCSVPGCSKPALDQGQGPSVCIDHDPGR